MDTAAGAIVISTVARTTRVKGSSIVFVLCAWSTVGMFPSCLRVVRFSPTKTCGTGQLEFPIVRACMPMRSLMCPVP